MFPHLSLPSLIIITFLAVLFFGQNKLPDLAKSVGSSIKEFKKGLQDVNDEISTVAKSAQVEPLAIDTKTE